MAPPFLRSSRADVRHTAAAQVSRRRAGHPPQMPQPLAGARDRLDVMDQLGHTDPSSPCASLAHAMRFSERESDRLNEGRDWAVLGQWHPGGGHSGVWTFQWARRVSNLRPLACEASALPLSYAPQGSCDCRGRKPPRAAAAQAAPSRSAGGGARRSATPVLERGRAEWTNRQPFNPGLLPLDVYLSPSSSGMDVPSRGEVLRRWGPLESSWG
jgi:hypothetical protein